MNKVLVFSSINKKTTEFTEFTIRALGLLGMSKQ